MCKYCALTARQYYESKLKWELNDKKLRHYMDKQKHGLLHVKVEDPISIIDAATSGSPPHKETADEDSDFDMSGTENIDDDDSSDTKEDTNDTAADPPGK